MWFCVSKLPEFPISLSFRSPAFTQHFQHSWKAAIAINENNPNWVIPTPRWTHLTAGSEVTADFTGMASWSRSQESSELLISSKRFHQVASVDLGTWHLIKQRGPEYRWAWAYGAITWLWWTDKNQGDTNSESFEGHLIGIQTVTTSVTTRVVAQKRGGAWTTDEIGAWAKWEGRSKLSLSITQTEPVSISEFNRERRIRAIIFPLTWNGIHPSA